MPLRPAHPHDPLTYQIIGAAMEVHRLLGCGFLEAVYREALCRVFDELPVPYRVEVQLPIMFKGRPLATVYRADLICHQAIIVELKAVRSLGSSDESQVLNYLKASRMTKALLINFGGRQLEASRFVGVNASYSVSSVSSVDVVALPNP